VRTSPSLLRILLVKLVVDFSTFYRDGIKPRRRKRFQWICGLWVNHSNAKIEEIARIGDHQTQNKSYERTFRKQVKPTHVRHGVKYSHEQKASAAAAQPIK
jgi:hypothetical protein